ncbi:MAG: stage V sporulation protein AD [Clostridia bacterium]|nr:stage V sporulation protein AD [Clostridia bacterium]MBQ6858558.1 stage V sporulation protein AD [Clostridia bacterium]MBQ7053108.1 stage V sporulation protein AD [Clostridia bacterium]
MRIMKEKEQVVEWMSRRIGERTVMLPGMPGIAAWASIVGTKEGDGPYGGKFDRVIPDELNGENSFEAAERSMLESAVKICAQHADCALTEVQMLLAGDLLNQIISAGFAARNLQIPFYGLYGACSTMSESLSIGSMLTDGGYADRLICATCSHFCTAERQYRAPLELGNQRTPTAQWTVTGAGAVMLCSGAAAAACPVVLTHTTCGRVIDLGISDANNMGAAMAPAAADTIAAHFRDTERNSGDYDMIVTGDLGRFGRTLLLKLLEEREIDVRPEKLFDCGSEIFSPEQDTHCGGSGCGCAASMLCAHILPELASGRLSRILFMATGALLSPTTTMQGESIPGVAHAVVMESRRRNG